MMRPQYGLASQNADETNRHRDSQADFPPAFVGAIKQPVEWRGSAADQHHRSHSYL